MKTLHETSAYTRKEKIGNAILYQGDSLSLLPCFPHGKVHYVLSDPPYGIDFADWDVLHANTNSALGKASPAQIGSSFPRRGKPINGWAESDRNIGKEYMKWCTRWGAHIPLLCVPGALVSMFNSRRFCAYLQMGLEESGLNARDIIAWIKPTAHFRAAKMKDFPGHRLGNMGPVFEPIVQLQVPYKGTITKCMQVDNVGAMNLQAWKRSTGTFNNIVYSEKVKSPKHPTQKPVSVLRSLIKTCSPVNGIVLDPFMGCGSSGVAALLENRKFVGVERSPAYFEAACLRIEKIVRTKLRKLKR